MADNEQNVDAPKQGELNDDDLDKVTGGGEQQRIYEGPPSDPM